MSIQADRHLLKNPLFEQSITVAKSFALAKGKKELSPLLVLAGINHILQNSEEDIPETLQSKKDNILAVSKRIGLVQTNIALPDSSVTLPLNGDLKRILSEAKNLGTFIDQCMEFYSKLDKDATGNFETVINLASALCKEKKYNEINEDIFAAAAYVAYEKGLLKTNANLANFMGVNHQLFELLLETNQWKKSDFKQSNEKPYLLTKDIQDFLKALDVLENKIIIICLFAARKAKTFSEKRNTAYHEAGHAVCSFILRPESPITHISVFDNAAGVTHMRSALSLSDLSQYSYFDEVCVDLAGRSAEQIFGKTDKLTEGAITDLENATNTAWTAIFKYGLDENFSAISLSALADMNQDTLFGPLFHQAQERLMEVLKAAEKKTETLLRDNWVYVENLAEALFEKDELSADEIIPLLTQESLMNWPHVVKAKSKALKRNVKFATENGIIDTLEGAVKYEPGDAIVEGAEGEKWPVNREKFHKLYSPNEIAFGEDGNYTKHSIEVLAFKFTGSSQIVLSQNRGTLSAKEGDWLVDYGNGDLAPVAGDRFANYYEISE